MIKHNVAIRDPLKRLSIESQIIVNFYKIYDRIKNHRVGKKNIAPIRSREVC